MAGSDDMAFGSGSSCVSGRDANRRHWVGPIVDSTVKPLLWWPGDGTKRWRRTGGGSTKLATLWLTRLAIRGAAGAVGRALIIAAAHAAVAVVVGVARGA